MKTLQQYLDEADEKFNPPVVGDNFAIEIEDVLIESYIVDIAEDGYVIAADDRVLELLEHCGCTEEHELQEQERLMEIPKELEEEASEEIAEDSLAGILKAAGLPPRKIREGFAPMEFAPLDEVSLDLAKRARDKAEYYVDMDYDDMRDRPEGYSEKQRSRFQRYIDRKEPRAKGDRDWDPPNKGVAEGFNSDLEMELHNLTKSPDMYDAIYNALGRNDEMGQHLQDMMYDVARENRLHSDDDIEQIIDIMADRLEDKYGDPDISEAKYQGRTVPLGKPMKGDVKKSKVYVKGPKGNVVKVNFGDKTMRIKKNIPGRRKNFRARHNCDNPGPRWKARYWSCRAW